MKYFLFRALAALLFWWSKTIHAILKEGIMGNIHVNLYEIWTSGSDGDVFKEISYLEFWQSLCSVGWNHLRNIGRRHHEEQK